MLFSKRKKSIASTHRASDSKAAPARLLFVTNRLGSGGAETHLLALIQALHARGYFLSVVSAGGALEKELEALGVPHRYAPLDSRAPWCVLKSAHILRRAVKEDRIDILHAHARLATLACRLAQGKARLVSTAHLDFSLDFFSRKLTFWGEKTLAVSEDIRAYLIDAYGLSYENIALTVNGIDTERFHPSLRQATKASHPCLLHISRLDRDRAYTAFLLCDILPTLYRQFQATLTIVGGGEMENALKEKVEAINRAYGPIITLTGAVSDIRPYLAKADLFVGVSRAALEAMACAIPTVLSGNSGYMGVFRLSLLDKAAKTNFCCRKERMATHRELENDLAFLLQAPEELRRTIGEEGRTAVVSRYSLSRMTQDYIALYESLRPYRRRRFEKKVILGYHGFQNSGDEAILSCMIAAIRKDEPEAGITVLSHSPAQTAAAYGVSAVSRHRPQALLALWHADTLYVGGGTLLQNQSSNRSLVYYTALIALSLLGNVRVVYWGNGIELHGRFWQPIVAFLLRRATAITLRDSPSFQAVQNRLAPFEDAPPCRLCADSALTLSPCDASRLAFLKERYDLNRYALIATNGCLKTEAYRAAITAAALLLWEKGLTPVFLLLHPNQDRREAVKIAARLKKCGIDTHLLAPSYRETLGLMQDAAFVLSSRLHGLIFAAAVNTPFLSFGKGEKGARFADALLPHEATVSAENFSQGELLGTLCRLYADRDALRARLSANTPPLKEEAAQIYPFLQKALEQKKQEAASSPKPRRRSKQPPLGQDHASP